MLDSSLDDAQDLPSNASMMMPSRRDVAADPHGRAALLLVQSLIHALVDKAVITHGEAINVIDVAADVEAAMAQSVRGEGMPEPSLLAPLASTFSIGLND